MTQANAGAKTAKSRAPGRKRTGGPKPKTAPRRKRRRPSWFRRTATRAARLLWQFGWRAACIGAVVLASWTGYHFLHLPPYGELLESRSRGSAVLLDRNETPFAWRGALFGGPVSSGEVSHFLKHAVIAAEDKRFYRHFGISPRGIAGAILINLREGRGPLQGHGGSTITQQVAKLLCLGRRFDRSSGLTETQFERGCRRTTLWRKAREIPFSFALELKYSKDQILDIYLNRVYLGAGATGFGAASQRYFGTSIGEVTPAQAAMLAGLLAAPSVYAPTRSVERAKSRANLIVGLMEREGYLSVSEALEALEHPAELSAGSAAKAGSYFADWVMETVPDFLVKNTTEDMVLRTTIDIRIQKAVDAALVDVFENKVKPGSRAEAAIVVLSSDGAVRAMTGGKDPRATGQFNRATQALRQTGSAFKPFVFAAALESGVRPNDTVSDEPVAFRVPGSGIWKPENHKGIYNGDISVAEAFAKSSNVVAARLSESVGRSRVRAIARKFGIRQKLAAGPALALGASESTLIQMTGAYAGILNGGVSVTPYGLVDIRIRGNDDPLFDGYGGSGERAVSRDTANQLIGMMNRVVTEGTGMRASLPDRPVAGKTGTTQGARDAWFIGFSADYVTGVWMGYDDNTPLTGVTGSGLPAEIWREAMQRIHKGTAPKPLPHSEPARERVGAVATADGESSG